MGNIVDNTIVQLTEWRQNSSVRISLALESDNVWTQSLFSSGYFLLATVSES